MPLQIPRIFLVCLIPFILSGEGRRIVFSEEVTAAKPQAALTALQRLNPFIGKWRGTGQVRRGSAKGAWRQSGEFVWDFSSKTPVIQYRVEDGQLAEEGKLTWTEDRGYQLHLNLGEEESRVYRGDWKDGKLVLVSDEDQDGVSYRISLNPLNEKRSLVLHEKTSSGGSSFFRIAEVGYTRAGTRLALPGGGQRECVVTGGTAETAVKYKGETYYVCCSGCKQAFDDDPEAIIAEFKEKLQKRLQNAK